ncbi:MAG: TspO/MBR family protein [Flavobacteriales bacterium]
MSMKWEVIPERSIGQVAIRILAAVVLTFLAALPGALTSEAVDGWFSTLDRPAFAPPNAVFGPVWTALYVMMGIAAGLVWAAGWRAPVKSALLLYCGQLVLNASWTIVFFGLHAPLAALFVIVALLVMICLTMRAFFPVHPLAGWLLSPYLGWVVFATMLNAGYVYLN